MGVWVDVTRNRVLWITRGKTDNARRRLVVPEILRPLLLQLAEGKEPAALLFGASSTGKPLTDAWLWGHVQRICDEAGVPRVSTHSLRGLHSTLALEAGATAGAVAAALGHGSFEITAKHYAAPGTVDRLRARRVEDTLGESDRSALPAAASAPPGEPEAADLFNRIRRLSPALRAELRKILDDPGP